MTEVITSEISAFSLQAARSQNKKITSFNLIRLHLQKKIILEMFITVPTKYSTVKSE